MQALGTVVSTLFWGPASRSPQRGWGYGLLQVSRVASNIPFSLARAAA